MKIWFNKYKIVIIILGCITLLFTIYKLYKKSHYTGELVGIKGTYIYHRDNCIFLKKASINSIVFFKDLQATAESGYRACNTCNPPNNEKELAVKETENIKYEAWVQQFREDWQAGKIDKKERSIYVEDRILQGTYPFDSYIHKSDIPQWIKEGKSEKP